MDKKIAIKDLATLDPEKVKEAISALNENPHVAITGWRYRSNYVMEDGSPVTDEAWEQVIDILSEYGDSEDTLETAKDIAGVMTQHEYKSSAKGHDNK